MCRVCSVQFDALLRQLKDVQALALLKRVGLGGIDLTRTTEWLRCIVLSLDVLGYQLPRQLLFEWFRAAGLVTRQVISHDIDVREGRGDEHTGHTILTDAAGISSDAFEFLTANAPLEVLDLAPLPPGHSTALHWVLSNRTPRREERAAWLIDRMTDDELNAVDANGHTALSMAFAWPDVSTELLLRRVPGIELEPERRAVCPLNGQPGMALSAAYSSVRSRSIRLPPRLQQLLGDARKCVAEFRAQQHTRLTALLSGERLCEVNTKVVGLPFVGLPLELIAIVIAYV